MTANADTAHPVDCILIGWTVQPASISMLVGDVVQLIAVAPPPCGGASQLPKVRWTSSNRAVASVDSLRGTVRGLAVGQATIIVSDVNDPNVKGAAAVQVNAR